MVSGGKTQIGGFAGFDEQTLLHWKHFRCKFIPGWHVVMASQHRNVIQVPATMSETQSLPPTAILVDRKHLKRRSKQQEN